MTINLIYKTIITLKIKFRIKILKIIIKNYSKIIKQ